MLKIRLQRVGRKHEPTFRLVLTDSHNSTKSGRYHEVLGSHDARREADTKFDADRVQYWISKGAQVSDTVHNLLVTKGIVKGKKINVLPRKSPIKKEGADVASEAPKVETAAQEVPQAAEASPEAPAA